MDYKKRAWNAAWAAYRLWAKGLRKLRLQRRWSQRQVAIQMICSRSQYAAIEYGHSLATYAQLYQLALAFKLTLPKLLAIAPVRFPPVLVRLAKERAMPRPKGSRVIVCNSCHARLVGMPGDRRSCCGRSYKIPAKPAAAKKTPKKPASKKRGKSA
jgi:transcriptional regulator with XRE-family HTH domain